jgi:hypothetical protein
MSNLLPTTPFSSIRNHPALSELFKNAESRFFTDEELAIISATCPTYSLFTDCAKEVRDKHPSIIDVVLEEILSQYPFEELYELPRIKLPRDWGYVVAYSTHSMVQQDARWFDDKLLIWFKTILQAFEFPSRKTPDNTTLFSDSVLEDTLKKLPAKCRSIFHTYYRIQQEYQKVLTPEFYQALAPHLELARGVLTEKY